MKTAPAVRSLAGAFALLAGVTLAYAPPAAAQATPSTRAAEVQGTGVRTLYLVRHGVYDEDDPSDPDLGRALIPEGREQARLTGARLAALPVKIAALHASTMTRARQTAEIIGEALGLTPRLSRDIRECTPPTYREDVMKGETPGGPDSCRMSLERAFPRYFRASPDRDSAEVIVCHGNVIRYFVCKALGADPKLWLGMTTINCGITVIQVRPDGRLRLVSYNDVGHIPPALQTSGWHRKASGDSLVKR